MKNLAHKIKDGLTIVMLGIALIQALRGLGSIGRDLVELEKRKKNTDREEGYIFFDSEGSNP